MGLIKQVHFNALRQAGKLILLLIFVPLTLFGQPNLRLEGILGGREPLAAINGKIFKQGQTVQGAKITKITNNKVYFYYQGESFSLGVNTGGWTQTGNKQRVMPEAKAKNNQQDGQSVKFYHEARKHYQKASRLAWNNLGKAEIYYRKAIQQAQWAIPKVSKQQQKEMTDIINNSRQVIAKFQRKKKQERAKGKIIIGMTTTEVRQIIGKPLTIEKSQQDLRTEKEKWVYGPRGPYLYFEDGFFVGYDGYKQH